MKINKLITFVSFFLFIIIIGSSNTISENKVLGINYATDGIIEYSTNKIYYNCFPNNLVDKNIIYCQNLYINITNLDSKKHTGNLSSIFPKNVNVYNSKIGNYIIDKNGNDILNWTDINLIDKSNSTKTKKDIEIIDIKGGEILQFKLSFLPINSSDGKFDVEFEYDLGKLNIDPWFNRSDGFYSGAIDDSYGGIYFHKGNYYIASGGSKIILNYTSGGIWVNNITADTGGAGANFVTDITGNGSVFWVISTTGVGSWFISENYPNGNILQWNEVTGDSIQYRAIAVNETSLASFDGDTGAGVGIYNRTGLIKIGGAGALADTCVTAESAEGAYWKNGNWYVLHKGNQIICNYTTGWINQTMEDNYIGGFGIDNAIGMANISDGIVVLDAIDNFVYHISTSPDNTAPTFNLSIIPSIAYSNTSILNGTFTVNDIDGDTLTVTTEWLNNSEKYFTRTFTMGNGFNSTNLSTDVWNSNENWTFNMTVSDGTTTVYNETSLKITDNVYPDIYIDFPVNSQQTCGNNIDIKYTASDDIGINTTVYNLFNSETNLSSISNTTVTSNFTMTLQSYSSLYRLRISVNDTSGNLNQSEVNFTALYCGPSGGGSTTSSGGGGTTTTTIPSSTVDTDGDGIVDSSDPDIDNDGIPNEIDPDPYVPNIIFLSTADIAQGAGGGGGGGTIEKVYAFFNLTRNALDPNKIDNYFIYSNFNNEVQKWLFEIHSTFPLKKCGAVENSDLFKCEIISNSTARIYVDFNDTGRFFGKIYKGKYEFEFQSGQLKNIPVTLRVYQLPYYFKINLNKFINIPLLFYTSEEGITEGIRAWWILSLSLISIIIYIRAALK